MGRGYLCISEEEDCVEILYSSHVIKLFEILVESCIIIASSQLYLETLVAIDVRCQPETYMYSIRIQ